MPGALLNTDSLGAVLSCSEAPSWLKTLSQYSMLGWNKKLQREKEAEEERKEGGDTSLVTYKLVAELG